VTSPQRSACLGAIAAALLLVGATACASESNDTTAASSGVGDPAPAAPAVGVPEALQFTAPLVGGGTFDGAAAAAAGKPTVFWFWAPT
jgi:hypothetical protein